jgi:hypothetical protein
MHINGRLEEAVNARVVADSPAGGLSAGRAQHDGRIDNGAQKGGQDPAVDVRQNLIEDDGVGFQPGAPGSSQHLSGVRARSNMPDGVAFDFERLSKAGVSGLERVNQQNNRS